MPKIPRNISGRKLVKLLKRFDYKPVRQTGSHIRLLSNYRENEHKITIPDHSSLNISTLTNILNDVSDYLNIEKENLVRILFEQ
ncbi:MAG: hypothetical protein QG657_3498 [Acidobacteriota bacterium]|nr:hypothetical protein [Acidobacteriota bacterium]